MIKEKTLWRNKEIILKESNGNSAVEKYTDFHENCIRRAQ